MKNLSPINEMRLKICENKIYMNKNKLKVDNNY